MHTFGRQRQEDLCEFETSLVYIASSRTTRMTQRNTVSTKQNKNVGVRSKPAVFCAWARPGVRNVGPALENAVLGM